MLIASQQDNPVVTDKFELAAKCEVCHKAVAWKHPMPVSAWKDILREFVKEHRKCLQ